MAQLIMHRKQYYAVKWGETIRLSSKVYDPSAACRDTFGMIHKNMEVCPLGGNKAEMLKATRDLTTLRFQPLPEEYLTKRKQ